MSSLILVSNTWPSCVLPSTGIAKLDFKLVLPNSGVGKMVVLHFFWRPAEPDKASGMKQPAQKPVQPNSGQNE